MFAYSENLDSEVFEAGRRVSDVLNQKIADHGWWDIRNKWMIFKLQDGSSNNVLYDTKKDAVRHQSNEFLYAYICFRGLGNGSTWRSAATFLKYTRELYDKGYRLPDPDDVHGGPQPAVTTNWMDYYWRKARMERAGLVLP